MEESIVHDLTEHKMTFVLIFPCSLHMDINTEAHILKGFEMFCFW